MILTSRIYINFVLETVWDKKKLWTNSRNSSISISISNSSINFKKIFLSTKISMGKEKCTQYTLYVHGIRAGEFNYICHLSEIIWCGWMRRIRLAHSTRSNLRSNAHRASFYTNTYTIFDLFFSLLATSKRRVYRTSFHII